MTLLPPFFLDAIVAIGERGDDGNCSWRASGFLYGKHVATDVAAEIRTYRTFLVTNRHVLAGKRSIVLRFNPVEAIPAREFDVELLAGDGKPYWTAHHDAGIDVAVLPISVNELEREGIRCNYFRSDDHALGREDAIAAGLSEGDSVFVLGFPMGQVGGDRNYPLVRQGAIARIRDWLAGASSEILVDASVFPGNSGGPVVSKPEFGSIVGTSYLKKADLIGVVASYVPYQDVAISTQTQRPRIVFEENSGLASVVPVDFVNQTIDQVPTEAAQSDAETEAPELPPEQGSIPEGRGKPAVSPRGRSKGRRSGKPRKDP